MSALVLFMAHSMVHFAEFNVLVMYNLKTQKGICQPPGASFHQNQVRPDQVRPGFY